MGLLDKVKGAIGGNKSKVKGGIDKTADMADEKTGGKYAEHIETGAEKAKDAVDRIDEN